MLGSPIGHSLSPRLQGIAYDRLGLPFDYGLAEVASGALAPFVDSLDESWRGLSLTMPLKREVVPLLDEASPLVRKLGVANTVVLSQVDGSRHLAGHNTDVDGITRAVSSRLADVNDLRGDETIIVGGGATAASALAAVAELGVGRVRLYLRDVTKASELSGLASSLGVALEALPLDRLADAGPADLAVSTLPGGAADDLPLTPSGPGAVLLDVAYDPWPSALATRWADAGGLIVSGLDMLIEQAVGQIRLFAGLPQTVSVPDEDAIRRDMRAAVGVPPVPVPVRVPVSLPVPGEVVR
ncbi:hypothetical protein AX769_20185 [Frondihabitans sp. PAMC 28766]|nr:hypothetical protein AX769_20185 [Frondihabitans sp. PAMC 28766]